MTNLLAKAARGFSGAVVDIADNALAELRQRRAQEFQYNLGAADRAQARADEKERADRSYDLQKTSTEHQMANSDKSLSIQEENMRADNQSRNAQLGIARDGLKLQQDNSEFGKVKFAYDQSLSGVELASKQLDEAIKMRPPIDKETGLPINDPNFGDTRAKAIEDAKSALHEAKVQAAKLHDEISSNPKFEKYSDYFPSIYKGTAPPLLRRPIN